MTRLIDADDFFRTFPELAIDPYINAPTVDADLCEYSDKLWKAAYERGKNERPHGEWIMNKTSARGRYYTCTNCKKVSRNNFDYCPMCGADMREADK